MQEIKAVIQADGSLSYTVNGVKGKACRDLTKVIDALGVVTETKNTAEYAACPLPVQQSQKTGQ